MITAEDLRELMKSNDAEVARIISLIEPKLIEMATVQNQKSYICREEGLTACHPTYMKGSATTLQQRVMSEIGRHGYRVAFEAVDAPYVPLGMQDDSGIGQEYSNWAVKISW